MAQVRRLRWPLLGIALLLLPGCVAMEWADTQQRDLKQRRWGRSLTRQVYGHYDGRTIDAGRIQPYLLSVLVGLATANGESNVYGLHLVDDGSVNFFSLPGNDIFLTRGVLLELDNESQLAAVLSLEIAHLKRAHLAKRIDAEEKRLRREQREAGLTRVGGSFSRENDLKTIGSESFKGLGAVMSSISAESEGFLAPFTIDEELAAHRDALTYMERAGYDPYEMIPFLTSMLEHGGADDRGASKMTTHHITPPLAHAVQGLVEQAWPKPRETWRIGSEAYYENVTAVIAR